MVPERLTTSQKIALIVLRGTVHPLGLDVNCLGGVAPIFLKDYPVFFLVVEGFQFRPPIDRGHFPPNFLWPVLAKEGQPLALLPCAVVRLGLGENYKSKALWLRGLWAPHAQGHRFYTSKQFGKTQDLFPRA